MTEKLLKFAEILTLGKKVGAYCNTPLAGNCGERLSGAYAIRPYGLVVDCYVWWVCGVWCVETHNCASLRGVMCDVRCGRDKACLVSTAVGEGDRISTGSMTGRPYRLRLFTCRPADGVGWGLVIDCYVWLM